LTYRDDLELLPDIERQRSQGAHQAVQHQRAQHRTFVIDQRQDHRLAAVEVVLELHRFAGFVAERQVEGHLRVELLIDADILKLRRHGIRGAK
jgi:hypothetical protein